MFLFIISHAMSTFPRVTRGRGVCVQTMYNFIGGGFDKWNEILICLFAFLLLFKCDTDKVFSPTCSTQKVYEEGAKDVALSALTGINGNCSYCLFSQANCDFNYVFRVMTGSVFQLQFSHMGRLAVARLIPWEESQKMLLRISMNISEM